jgi:hypothetical protein
LRLVIVVGGPGAFVPAFGNRAEIILADGASCREKAASASLELVFGMRVDRLPSGTGKRSDARRD